MCVCPYKETIKGEEIMNFTGSVRYMGRFGGERGGVKMIQIQKSYRIKKETI